MLFSFIFLVILIYAMNAKHDNLQEQDVITLCCVSSTTMIWTLMVFIYVRIHIVDLNLLRIMLSFSLHALGL